MIEISECSDKEIIKSIITDPTLWKLEYGQGMRLEDYKVDETFDYLLIKRDNEVLGLFQTRALTRILVEIHIYLLPTYWGDNTSLHVSKAVLEYLACNTTYYSAFTDVPKECKHVQRLIERVGGKRCGFIEDGVIYNNKLQDLFLYQYKLR